MAYVFAISFVAAVGGFLYGYDGGIIIGANLFLREQFQLSDVGWAFASTSMVVGAITGPFLGAWVCDRFGRKNTFIIASVLFSVSAVFTAIPRDIVTFNIFRFVGGVGVGLCSIASPMYIAEVAPPRIRGALGILYQLALVVGALCSLVVSYFLAQHLPESVSWRWMFFSETVAIAGFAICLFFIPRSPRWLAQRGRDGQALEILTRIDGPEHARKELAEIRESLDQETGTFSELLQPGIRFALGIGILLALFNNLTGFSAISHYIPALFLKSGFSEKSEAILQGLIVYGFMGVLTLVSIGLVDRFGRRRLWMFSSLFMLAALVITASVFHYEMKGKLVLFAILLVTIPHALGLGPLPWLMMSELFPTRIRARAVAITTTVLWTAGFTGSFIFPPLMGFAERQFGSVGPAFLLFAVVNVFSFLFGWKWLPETKGRTLEEIADSWKTG